jgi:hypothetical protein
MWVAAAAIAAAVAFMGSRLAQADVCAPSGEPHRWVGANSATGIVFDVQLSTSMNVYGLRVRQNGGSPPRFVGVWHRSGTSVGNEQSSAGWTQWAGETPSRTEAEQGVVVVDTNSRTLAAGRHGFFVSAENSVRYERNIGTHTQGTVTFLSGNGVSVSSAQNPFTAGSSLTPQRDFVGCFVTQPLPPPPSLSSEKLSNDGSPALVALIVLGSVFGMLAVAVVIILILRVQQRRAAETVAARNYMDSEFGTDTSAGDVDSDLERDLDQLLERLSSSESDQAQDGRGVLQSSSSSSSSSSGALGDDAF